jgi:Flp pilus assembly protein TadG
MKNARGQAMVELALILPLATVLVLGVVEVSYALLDEHIITKLAREGSNLISRDATLADATNALKNMSSGPVDFTKSSKVIFSVVKHVTTTGVPNSNKDVLYQRFEYGAIAATSTFTTAGTGSFGGAPDYIANNSDNDTRLQVTNLPANLLINGGMVYVTEIFSKHTPLTPFDKFGIQMPTTLYSIAYF